MSMRVGVMTGGGDAPGLNAAICGLGRRLMEAECELIGFADGWRGLLDDETRDIESWNFQHLLVHGGTMLGSSSAYPYRDPKVQVPTVLATIARHRLDALVAIGGEGTLGAADRLFRENQVPVVGIPKTIDNDLDATDFTFGFWSAVEVATRAMDDLRCTAESHSRVMVVECMGRHAGWITAYAGIAAGAEGILVPERDAHVESLCERLAKVKKSGARHAIVAVAEGTRVFENKQSLSSSQIDEWGNPRIGGVAELIAGKVRDLLGWDARSLVLDKNFGRMASMQAGSIVDVPLRDAVAKRKVLSPEFLDKYESFFLPMGDS